MYYKILDIFLVCAKNGSFLKTANALYMGHAAIIKQINHLEEHYQVRLFERTSKGIQLTKAGQLLYDETIKIKEHSKKVIEKMQEVENQKILRLGVTLVEPSSSFLDLWDAIYNQFNDYSLQVVSIKEENRYSGLGKEYDFFVGPYDLQYEKMYTFVLLGSYQFAITMNRKHSLAKEKSLSLKALEGYSLMIARTERSPINDKIRHEIENNYPKIKIIDIDVPYSIETFNRCAEQNQMMLSLECWNKVHPDLKTVLLEENYRMPYGLVAPQLLNDKLKKFIEKLQLFI